MYNEQLRNVERAFLDTSGLARSNYLYLFYSINYKIFEKI